MSGAPLTVNVRLEVDLEDEINADPAGERTGTRDPG